MCMYRAAVAKFIDVRAEGIAGLIFPLRTVAWSPYTPQAQVHACKSGFAEVKAPHTHVRHIRIEFAAHICSMERLLHAQ